MFEETDFAREFEVAVEAAEEAGKIIDRYAGGKAKIEGEKRVNDIYTEADIKSQERVVDIISEKFPEDGFLAEEDLEYPEVGENGRRWTIDPVDGTSNFQNGLDYFCVSIAFEVDGDKKIGVVYSPEKGLGKIFFAVKNFGAFRSDSLEDLSSAKELKVSDEDDPRRSLVFSRISNVEGEYSDQKELWAEMVETGTHIRYMGSGALEVSKVAAGSGEAFISNTEAKWDFAAAELIVREAGGEVEIEESDIPGKQRIIASNGKIHGFLKEVSQEFYE